MTWDLRVFRQSFCRLPKPCIRYEPPCTTLESRLYDITMLHMFLTKESVNHDKAFPCYVPFLTLRVHAHARTRSPGQRIYHANTAKLVLVLSSSTHHTCYARFDTLHRRIKGFER